MSWHPPWTEAQAAALSHHVLGGRLSYSGVADAINAEFNTSYSRNSCIGKAGRLGLVNPYWQKMVAMVKKPRKPQAYKPRPKRPMQSHEHIMLKCSEIMPGNVSLIDLTNNGCRYPVNEVFPFLFCNHAQLEGSSYCAGHYRLSIRLDPAHRSKQLEAA